MHCLAGVALDLDPVKAEMLRRALMLSCDQWVQAKPQRTGK